MILLSSLRKKKKKLKIDYSCRRKNETFCGFYRPHEILIRHRRSCNCALWVAIWPTIDKNAFIGNVHSGNSKRMSLFWKLLSAGLFTECSISN